MSGHWIFMLIFSAVTLAAPIPDLESWLSDEFPKTEGGTAIQDELQCYSLPYGAIGFASHILTYWTVCFIASSRSPLRPWKRLEHSRWDLALSTISLIISVLLAIFTIVHCRNSWQFVVIAVWKMAMSFTLGMIGLHRAFQLSQSKEGGFSVWWWLTAYALGTIVGLSGILSLVGETFSTFPNVRTITYVFTGVAGGAGLGIFLLGAFIKCFGTESESEGMLTRSMLSGVLVPIVVFGVLAAFYSDWILAAIANNGWAGAPSDDNKWLYWTYFVAKRIPLFVS